MADQLTTEERKRVLTAKIQEYIAKGYQLVNKDDTSAQLTKKKFSFWSFILLAGIFYLPWYWAKKDKLIFITVDEYGNFTETEGKG